MAKRKKSNGCAGGLGTLILGFLLLGVVVGMVSAIIDLISKNIEIFIIFLLLIITVIVIIVVIKNRIDKQRKELQEEIMKALHMGVVKMFIPEYDDRVVVKSRQTLDNYTDLKYLKENDCFDTVKMVSEEKSRNKSNITDFLKENDYKDRPQYAFVEKQLTDYLKSADGYRIQIVYITSAGNNQGQRMISISESRIKEIEAHPEYLMTKGEYNRFLKQQAMEELEAKKHGYFDLVNSIIDYANESKEELVVKDKAKKLDELVQSLIDRTINSIQKIKQIDSDECYFLEMIINDTDNQIRKLVEDDRRISEYYSSQDFAIIKETSHLLAESQRDFNEYIDEKAQSISKLFGKRTVRNETKNADVYNYIRPYKKSITPFTAEVSSYVFGSAENDPIPYIVKYFYPYKSQYKVQIQQLKTLIEELETLEEAKDIIDNYKRDYDKYLENVPDYVLEDDEDGFYSRLGLTIINEEVLNVEYRFIYTSDGGMAQRSFSVPMTEETIIELINALESKLSMEAFSKEQRAMMTTKLRTYIKERDNYTCCECGNSVKAEPNLLLEIDHIIPISKGGLTKEDNLQTLCWKCNRSKGAKLISEP